MINVKLVVLFILITIGKCRGRYCEICSNHTLCKFPRPEPSTNCRGYDKTAHLTKYDVTEIVNRINERRNSIALGHSKNLPPAANMRKIEWSETLAMFAQRWVNQCDPSVHPDKEDHCRDLDDTPVGQNVATITGPSPGLQVKSFIDVWFMQILDYAGSVSYYNQSRDAKTNYFTQLIWAQTDTVGCGKAKFFIHNGSTMTERLVCNFAPKGNIHGKTVYAIGIAATQCPDNSTPDTKLTGLCRYKIQGSGINTFKRPSNSSSLRILNLANNSAKQDIDPIRNNLKQMKFSGNRTDDQRNQKIRHVFMNNTYAGIPHDPPQQLHWKHPINISKIPGFRRNEQVERGHSRVYHGHGHKDNSVPQYQENVDDNFRRYDLTTQTLISYPTSSSNFRKHYQQCTRKLAVNLDSVSYAMRERVEQCTRRSKSDCCLLTPLWHQPPVPDLCSCSIHRSTYPPSTTQCNCKINCHCPSMTSESIDYPKLARRQEEAIKDKTRIPSEFQYYDLLPNIAIRSGDTVSDKQYNEGTTTSNNNLWLLKSTDIDHKHLKTMSHKREYQKKNRQGIDAPKHPKYIDPERDYSYDSFDSSERQRREPEEQMTLKPFWQMDEYVYKQPSQLKAMRYTTLANKRNRKSKTQNIVTEPITIRYNPYIRNHEGHITEKYLSFDELMHLRKLNAEDYDARRANTPTTKAAATTKKAAPTKKASAATKSTATTKKAAATTKAGATTKGSTTTKVAKTLATTKKLKEATEEYTINTPFERKKHCTRKLTCTWTLPTITANDGSVIDPNKRGGSRTPPGYVEGCTRTSTCTRDFLNRNKMSSATDVPGSDNNSDTDEDYCERRSLNVQRRNSDEEYISVQNTGYQIAYTDTPTTIFVNHNREVVDSVSNKDDIFLDDCVCHEENSRNKRNSKEYDEKYFVPSYVNFHNKKKKASSQYSLSYGDLYYLILNKIVKTWNDNKNSLHSGDCTCNKSVVAKNFTVLTIFSILYKITLN